MQKDKKFQLRVAKICKAKTKGDIEAALAEICSAYKSKELTRGQRKALHCKKMLLEAALAEKERELWVLQNQPNSGTSSLPKEDLRGGSRPGQGRGNRHKHRALTHRGTGKRERLNYFTGHSTDRVFNRNW